MGAATETAKLQAAFEHALDAILIGVGPILTDANPAACALVGLPRERIVGRAFHEFHRPQDQEETARLFATLLAEGHVRGDIDIVRGDGTVRRVEFSATADILPGVHLSILRDVTERAEMQANLLHADRLAAVGTLAAGVAHEINNPLAYAMGNLDMLARRLPDVVARLEAEAAATPDAGTPARLGALAAELGEALEMLAVAREGAGRVRTIVLDLRRFSRPDEAQVGPVDVHEVLEYAIGMAINDIRHRARMVRAYGAAPSVVVNESRLGQVFLNLLVNAAQAIPEGRADEHEIRVGTGTDAGGRLVVEVADTGVGIPAHLLGRVFDPFLTTKPFGEGTGLGLFVSRSIVKDAGGEISVESEVGRGTTVRVVLPPASPDLTLPVGPPAVARV